MRPPRLDYPGAFHHVTNRGRNHQDVFLESADHERFLKHMAEASRLHGVEIHAYVLMTNHYHVLVRSAAGELSEAMQLLGSRYTQEFNAHHGCDGALFKGRFFSKLVDSEPYLLEALRYIANNPVKAGLVATPQDYQWSSFASAIGLAPVPEFLNLQLLDSYFDADPRSFAAFVNRADSSRAAMFRHLIEGDSTDQVLSTAIAQIEMALAAVSDLAGASNERAHVLQRLLQYVCESCTVGPPDIVDPRCRTDLDARYLFIALLRHHRVAPVEQIAAAFGLSASGARSAIGRLNKRALVDNQIRDMLTAGRHLFPQAA